MDKRKNFLKFNNSLIIYDSKNCPHKYICVKKNIYNLLIRKMMQQIFS